MVVSRFFPLVRFVRLAPLQPELMDVFLICFFLLTDLLFSSFRPCCGCFVFAVLVVVLSVGAGFAGWLDVWYWTGACLGCFSPGSASFVLLPGDYCARYALQWAFCWGGLWLPVGVGALRFLPCGLAFRIVLLGRDFSPLCLRSCF